ncbi:MULTISPECIES: enolase C-terminal domain-like protein [Rhizobium/Agrobacterium group]|uniref:Enolase n=2 Tax=Agrobacterium TaxID=357 RepID=A0A546XJ45_AGRTU|nr:MULTISPECIES: enolase C-terminal domain-like protein [Rhizobium/Agrobacterium group]MCZ7472260.1 phosphopyruvate hydratase [Rhizobium rhizogenes]MCZ7483287.1 phosphopyruvate hydratase [Rhizobium rhizogenes]MCZ7501730.1 phosphopyruvate hydratase [Rhizobium rhizogenes]MEB3046147.1 enolase C-terminal domain-like protein [Rhizobium sp. MJ21]TRB00773.1 phosphopyruvate hydratase [Agrobacterium tumefaciens]
MEDRIASIFAQQIIDCKCRPAVEVEIRTESGAVGRGAAPTGSSVGMHEAFVLRDGDKSTYGGLSVHKAVQKVETIIAPALIGMDVFDQRAIDEKMIAIDGTPDKGSLGGNTIYSVSIAAFRAAADALRIPLYDHIAGGTIKTVPVPCFNVINGGKYDGFIQSFNEFLIVPYGTDSIDVSIEMAVTVFQELSHVLTRHLGHKPQVASSYGYAAPSDDPEVLLDLMQQAIDACGYTGRIAFALDCASSEFFDAESRTYLLKGQRVTSDELIAYAKRLTEKYDFVFIEDLLDENDWDGYVKANREIDRTIILGDDLTVTKLQYLKRAFETKAVGGFILKPNQVGTITEAMDAHRYASEHGIISVPSGRSGGVVDDVVMDFSVGLQVPFQKNGAPRSGERIEKLNFLMRANARSAGCRLYDIKPLLKF